MSTKRFIARLGLDNSNNTITNVANPIYGTDAANKNTTDSILYIAQGAFDAANNVAPQIEPAFNAANTATTNAQSAFNQANTATTNAGSAFGAANTATETAQSAFNQANTATTNAQSAFGAANTANINAANASYLSTGTINVVLLGSGTANANTYLRGDGTWAYVAASGGASVTIANTAPNSPQAGNLWWDNSEGEGTLRIYYNDGSSSQWVDANPSSSAEIAYNIALVANSMALNATTIAQNAFTQSNTATTIAQSAFTVANTAITTKVSKTSNTGSAIIPTGNTAQRDSSGYGYFRYNTDSSSFEGYTAAGWGPIGGGVTIANTAPNSPQAGNLWWDSDLGKLFVYYDDGSSSQWVEASPNQAGVTATPVRQTFTATANQTNFTITGGYTPGLVDVFLNGTKLLNGSDVIVGSGTDVILSLPAIANSIVDVVGLNSMALANTISITGGTFLGDLIVPNINITGTVTAGNTIPALDNTYNLGSSSYRWSNVYTADMHFSNEGTDGNSIDGTTGNWTLQEGLDSIYLINNKNGKRYRIKLEEV